MTLAELLRHASETDGGRVAVAVEAGESLTYESWERRSSAQAHGLTAAGVRAGDRVALLFDSTRWTEYAVTYIAVQKVGAVAVPLQADLTGFELQRILCDCDASAVVAPHLTPGRCESRGPIIRPDELQHGDAELFPAGPSDLAEVLYVSHPLRPPAAFPRSHRDLLTVPSRISDAAVPALLHSFPVGTVAGQDMLCASLSAAPVRSVVLPAFDPDVVYGLVSAGRISGCALHPATAQALLDSDECHHRDLSRLRTLILASGQVSRTLLPRLAAAFPRATLLLVDGLGSPPGVRTVFAYDRSRPASVGKPAAEKAVGVAGKRGRAPPGGEGGQAWADGSSAAPVAFSQVGMLWHEHFAPGSQNLPGLARRYRGPLDPGALARALEEIVRRHEVLRTTFALRDSQPVQVIRPHSPLELPLCDLSDRPPAERGAELERLVAAAGRRPFDLVEGPLFDPALLRLDNEDHVLVIRTHHSVLDDWSVGVFRRELAALYPAYAAGKPSPLPEPPLQFADFARGQRRTLAGAAGERQLSYWRRELAGSSLITQLPVDDPNLPDGSRQRAGEPISLELPRELSDELRELARRERATVFMALLTAFGVLVQRYTGSDDLVLATVVANRNRTELEGLIGCFAKKVPLRLRLSGDPSFSEALTRTRAALLGAMAHQDLPFETVVQDVLGASAASHGLVPHVPVMFQGVTPQHELALPNIDTTGLQTSASAKRAHFMAAPDDSAAAGDPADVPWGAGLYLGTFVILSLNEAREGLSLVARGAFHGPAMSELMKRFHSLLVDVAAHPDRRVSELVLLDRRSAAEALRGGVGPAGCGAADTLHAQFTAQVRRTPDALAVHLPAESLTFAQLDARSDRLAERLRALGVGPEARVGIALEPSAELVVAVLGVWKTGGAWVGLDPADATDRQKWIVRDASLEIVVGDAPDDGMSSLVQVLTVDADDEREATPARRGVATAPDDAAVVFYGSGPSAVGRGVVLNHRSVLGLLTGLRHGIHREPGGAVHGRRVCLSAGPTQDAFLRQLVALLDGHSLHISDLSDPHEAVSLLPTGAVDLLDCTVDEFETLLEAGLREALASREHPCQAVIVVGTRSAVGPELWQALRELPGARAHVVYGPPECAFGATIGRAGTSAPRGVGHTMAGAQSHVLDPRGRPVPTRAVGELHLGGASLARGYVGHGEGSQEMFVELALNGAATRLHRTGQLARYLPDRGVEILGPLDGDGDLRGFRIEPERIRSALARCPGVRKVAVEHDRGDGSEQRLVAHVVSDGSATPARLGAFLWSKLPGYAWPARVLTGAPPDAMGTEPSWEQGLLGALWAEVLGLERVLPEENYWQAFSFLEALARARDAGVAVPGEQVTRNRTIGTLATALAAGRQCRRLG